MENIRILPERPLSEASRRVVLVIAISYLCGRSLIGIEGRIKWRIVVEINRVIDIRGLHSVGTSRGASSAEVSCVGEVLRLRTNRLIGSARISRNRKDVIGHGTGWSLVSIGTIACLIDVLHGTVRVLSPTISIV